MQNILVSRTDAIGDVVLTLPVCGLIKKYFPESRVYFLGNSYTKEVIARCQHVDEFVNYDDWRDDNVSIEVIKNLRLDAFIHVFPNKRIANLVRKANVPLRIGTRNRYYHWMTCNKLIKLGRKNSLLHEAQLNTKLLEGLGLEVLLKPKDLSLYYGFKKEYDPSFDAILCKDKFNLIIHPKSSGSAREWSLHHYSELIQKLSSDKYRVFITGSKAEKEKLGNWINTLGDRVIDLTGKFTLGQFISFIQQADGLVAASTGPLHLAAASGIYALGMYPNFTSINARRWGPLGNKALFVESRTSNMDEINQDEIFKIINSWQ